MRLFLTLVLLITFRFLSAQWLDNNSFRLVNSSYDEQDPVISPDGQTLYFTIGNHPQNMGGKKDPGDIWISRLSGNEWTAPVNAGSLLNDRSYNAVAGISMNGTQLFLHGHYDPSGGIAKTQGISISSNSGNGWSRPANINIPYFLNKSGTLNGSITPDNSIFVFSAETYGTHGVDDIYVSVNTNGKWSEPKNLGTTINTQFQELSPYLSTDGKTLYFSSNGRKGSGGFDVYSSTRLDDSWTNWSEPVNMGASINSPGRELYFRFFSGPGFALFTSTINSDGYGDIKIHRPEVPPVRDTATVVVQATPDTVVRIVEVKYDSAQEQPDTRIKIYGKITSTKTGEPVSATISFAGFGINNTITTSSASGYEVLIPSTEEYTIKIEAPGYVSTMENLDVHTYEMQELEMNFKLQPVEIGTTVNLKSVLFAQTKADILPESFPELDMVVNFLNSNPNVRIELAGHTDNRGIHQDNVKLSFQRVNKVKEYLVSKGIDPKRISGRGYGGTKPIASNDTEESRRKNRRVEFTIKKF